MDKLNVLIAGSTGYIGTQLVKLLCKHKNIKIKYLCGNTSVGKNISSYDKDLKKYKLPKIIKINYKLFKDVDVIFTSLPNGESQKIANKLLKKNIMIDLSADFRLKNPKIYNKYYGIKHKSLDNLKKSVYGLSEINKKNLSGGLTVTDQEVKKTILELSENLKIVVEPGGAVAAAALLNNKIDTKNKTIIVIISGGNIDSQMFLNIVKEF